MSRRIDRLLCTATEAMQLVQSGQTVACGGFVGAAHPEALTAALEQRFLEAGHPRELTLLYAAGQGDGESRGLNHLGHEGLLKRVIGGHWGLAPRIGRLALEDRIEAYNFPQGVICQLLRDIAAGRPGCVTRVGMGTFIDPLMNGGRLNTRPSPDLVERVELAGETWLLYRSFPLHVGLIRGTAADPHGNLLMDEEAIVGEVLPIAQAVHNSGGVVIAQVRELRDEPARPMDVRVPGVLIDRVVVAAAGEHDQTFAEPHNASYFSPQPGGFDLEATSHLPHVDSLVRRLVVARACDELRPGAIANLGIGMPEGIALIAAERGLLGSVTLTLESGPIGGIPSGGLSFGASMYPEAIVDQPAQFDFYDGGGLDFAALGAAEIDPRGNVNVSRFGSRLAGVGGFVNISQSARRVVFCGTLTSGGLEVEVHGGRLTIMREGRVRKFVPQLTQLSFAAQQALQNEQHVMYVTERAVFELTADGLRLIEIVDGIDIERDIISQMGFRPVIDQYTVRPAGGAN